MEIQVTTFRCYLKGPTDPPSWGEKQSLDHGAKTLPASTDSTRMRQGISYTRPCHLAHDPSVQLSVRFGGRMSSLLRCWASLESLMPPEDWFHLQHAEFIADARLKGKTSTEKTTPKRLAPSGGHTTHKQHMARGTEEAQMSKQEGHRAIQ